MNSSLAFSDTGLKYKKFKVKILSKDIKALILLFKKKIKAEICHKYMSYSSKI